jgi:hypothetical protein
MRSQGCRGGRRWRSFPLRLVLICRLRRTRRGVHRNFRGSRLDSGCKDTEHPHGQDAHANAEGQKRANRGGQVRTPKAAPSPQPFVRVVPACFIAQEMKCRRAQCSETQERQAHTVGFTSDVSTFHTAWRKTRSAPAPPAFTISSARTNSDAAWSRCWACAKAIRSCSGVNGARAARGSFNALVPRPVAAHPARHSTPSARACAPIRCPSRSRANVPSQSCRTSLASLVRRSG